MLTEQKIMEIAKKYICVCGDHSSETAIPENQICDFVGDIEKELFLNFLPEINLKMNNLYNDTLLMKIYWYRTGDLSETTEAIISPEYAYYMIKNRKEVLEENINKLKRRYPQGFSEKDSREREE